MALYLTGIIIDCAAILATGGYYVYYSLSKRELREPKHYYWITIASISSILATSCYFFFAGNLTTASILAWVMAVPIVVTLLFILMIIIFRPNWN